MTFFNGSGSCLKAILEHLILTGEWPLGSTVEDLQALLVEAIKNNTVLLGLGGKDIYKKGGLLERVAMTVMTGEPYTLHPKP